MLKHLPIVLLAVVGGFLVATWWPAAPDALRALLTGPQHAPTIAHPEVTPAAVPEPERSRLVRLTDDQVATARIRVSRVGEGRLARHLHVPGTIVPSADGTAR